MQKAQSHQSLKLHIWTHSCLLPNSPWDCLSASVAAVFLWLFAELLLIIFVCCEDKLTAWAKVRRHRFVKIMSEDTCWLSFKKIVLCYIYVTKDASFVSYHNHTCVGTTSIEPLFYRPFALFSVISSSLCNPYHLFSFLLLSVSVPPCPLLFSVSSSLSCPFNLFLRLSAAFPESPSPGFVMAPVIQEDVMRDGSGEVLFPEAQSPPDPNFFYCQTGYCIV